MLPAICQNSFSGGQNLVEQVPFSLAGRGVIFRDRSTPYFSTSGDPDYYIGEATEDEGGGGFGG